MHKKFFLNEKIIQIYILLIPFVSAFAINSWLPLPLIFMIIVSIYVIFSRQLKFFTEDWEIFLVIILGIVGFVFSLSYFGVKNINHTLAILTSVFFFYIVPKSLLIKFKSVNVFVNYVVISLAIVSAFVIIEFIGSNYFGINFLNLIPYTRSDLGDATVVGQYIRPRGFAEEGGHMALFYELSLPLSFLYFKNKGFLSQIFFYIPVFTGFILLFSSAAFICIIVALTALFSLNIRSKKSFALSVAMICIVLLVIVSDVTKPFVEATVGVRVATFLNPSQGYNSSASERLQLYQNALVVFLSAPLGIGWGMTSQIASEKQRFSGIAFEDAGFINLYAEILVACGFLGLILFIKFIGKRIVRLARSRSFESQMVFLSVFSLSLHYIFISNYWFPMLWFSLALADTVTRAENKCKIEINKDKTCKLN